MAKVGAFFVLREVAIWTKPLARRTLPPVSRDGFLSYKICVLSDNKLRCAVLYRTYQFSTIWVRALLRRSNSETAIENPQIKVSSPASAANASGLIQIPLSQVPRREALGSTRTLGIGALVDRVLRFIVNLSQAIAAFNVFVHLCASRHVESLESRGSRRSLINRSAPASSHLA
jgi:hypothetical protein